MKNVFGFIVFGLIASSALAQNATQPKKLVLMAGKPSHPPRMHEFNAGVQLLAKCLRDVPSLKTEVVLNGWPKDEKVFEGADAVVFYMDGGAKHEAVQEGRRRLDMIDGWTKRGVGIGCMHYGVEVLTDQAGDEFNRWIGGHYENMFSCNPIWSPTFASLPNHPITRGVKPFAANDEWYFNMRFITRDAGNKAEEVAGEKFTPILVAAPSDAVRDGPYVYPKGPYPHIQADKGRAECMMWAVERPDSGRGFGFTGGHFHDNWADDDYRKTILNALVWVAKAEIPAGGVVSSVTQADLDANLDPKPQPKAKTK
jgi:type 1 glutamine amidotransferase